MEKRIDFRPRVKTVSDSVVADWARVPVGGHGVQFYHTDEQLLRRLTRYVGTSLVGGDVAIVVATRLHLATLERRLAARGLDLSVARGEGRYVTADAQTMLEQLLTDGCVDEPKALSVLNALIRGVCGRLNADGEPVRVFAFGEMVALLAAQEGHEEAVRLEELWNTLSGVYTFTLCCGYPMSVFGPRHAAPFVRICGTHSHVFHASPYGFEPLT